MNAKLIAIDNYDSFTFNLIQMFGAFDLEIQVFRNASIGIEQISEFSPDYLLISPGPGSPEQAGISKHVIWRFYRHLPVLGVCLGMQCINELFGGETVHSPVPVHGKTSKISHNQENIFYQVPDPFQAARYHSLQVSKPQDSPLLISAVNEEGLIMGIEHPKYPLFGLQFHPESFLTEHGYRLVENFLKAG